MPFFRLFKPRFPVVRQYDRTDCGPAALLSVLKYYGGDASIVAVRELAHTGANGTMLRSLLRAAEALGFEASGARGEFDDLRSVTLPCIAHVVPEGGPTHFVVVYRVSHDSLLIGDPARGLYSLGRDAFMRIWVTRSVLLLPPTARLRRSPAPHWFPWLVSYFRREWAWVVQSVFLGLAYTVVGLLTAVFLQRLIDSFIPARNVSTIVVVGVFLLALQVLRAVIGYVRQRFIVELNRRVSTGVASDAFTHLFRLPTNFFESYRTGDITARFNDSGRIQGALLRVLGVTTIDSLVLAGSMVFLFVLTPAIAWVAVLAVPLFFAVLIVGTRSVRAQHGEAMQSYARVESSYIESLSAIEAIRSFTSTTFFATLTAGLYRRYQDRVADLGMLHARVALSTEATAGLLTVTMLMVGAVLVLRGDLSVGQMMAAYALFASMMPAAARIVESHISLQEAHVATRRLMDVLLVRQEARGGEGGFVMRRSLGIRGGGFEWPNGGRLFGGLDLTLDHGRLVGLCGASGVGKSTLIKILERKYALTEGALYVDDVPVDTIDIVEYRRRVAVLPQDVPIINGTVADNLLLGRSSVAPEGLMARIEERGLENMLERFPAGIRTIVGDQGRRISTGERQILGLMRALIGRPSVLLVDEGLSSVDVETASAMLRTLVDYAKHHAVMIVSHHLRSLLHADRVYVMRCGSVVEEGNPHDLVNGPTEFCRLLELQERLAVPA